MSNLHEREEKAGQSKSALTSLKEPLIPNNSPAKKLILPRLRTRRPRTRLR